MDKKKRVPGDQPIAWPKAEEASRALAQCPKGKVALASAPSASSAALLGTCRGGREPGRQLSSQNGICRTSLSGLLFWVGSGSTIADAADGADGIFGK